RHRPRPGAGRGRHNPSGRCARTTQAVQFTRMAPLPRAAPQRLLTIRASPDEERRSCPAPVAAEIADPAWHSIRLVIVARSNRAWPGPGPSPDGQSFMLTLPPSPSLPLPQPRRTTARASRPSLIDLRFKGDPWVVAHTDGTAS